MSKPRPGADIVSDVMVPEADSKSAPKTKTKPGRKLWPVVLSLFVGLILGAGGIFLALRQRSHQSQPTVPPDISAQLSFSVFAPKPEDGYTFDGFSYDAASGVLTFTAHGGEANYTITEQATPDNFNDIPEYFDKLVETLLEYKRFEVEIGRVSLTKPKEFNGQQAGVVNTRGTLMFARPDKDLSDEAWRKFYLSMQTTK